VVSLNNSFYSTTCPGIGSTLFYCYISNDYFIHELEDITITLIQQTIIVLFHCFKVAIYLVSQIYYKIRSESIIINNHSYLHFLKNNQ